MSTTEFELPPYKMDHNSRGSVLIFDNNKYPERGLKDRDFNMKDRLRMMGSLAALGYKTKDIASKTNQTAEQMKKAIEFVAKQDHTNSDSVVVIFLAYGEQNVVEAANRTVALQWLLSPLKGDKCHESLVGKPKIIILQTCQPTVRTYENAPLKKKIPVTRTIPPEADFLYLGTDVHGLYKDRTLSDGSLLIHHLSENLKNHATLEIRKIITRTLGDVVQEMDKMEPGWGDKNDDRMPYFINMLTRDLYFKQKE